MQDLLDSRHVLRSIVSRQLKDVEYGAFAELISAICIVLRGIDHGPTPDSAIDELAAVSETCYEWTAVYPARCVGEAALGHSSPRIVTCFRSYLSRPF